MLVGAVSSIFCHPLVVTEDARPKYKCRPSGRQRRQHRRKAELALRAKPARGRDDFDRRRRAAGSRAAQGEAMAAASTVAHAKPAVRQSAASGRAH